MKTSIKFSLLTLFVATLISCGGAEETQDVESVLASKDLAQIEALSAQLSAEKASIEADLKVVELNHKLRLPFKNCYKTPKTLGVDRIALVSASVNQFPDQNVLVIDAGTCITYDFVTQRNEYLGGAISPGIRLRYESLHNLTANLPLLKKRQPENIIGNSTKSSIHSGVVIGVVKEMDGVINQYKAEHQDLTVILTGGDANFLSNQLKNSIFANSNFLLEGLNYILHLNS